MVVCTPSPHLLLCRGALGTLPIEVKVDGVDTVQEDLKLLKGNTQYEIAITAVYGQLGEGPPSTEILYGKSEIFSYKRKCIL